MVAEADISLREWIKSALKCSEKGVSVGGSYRGGDAVSWDYLLASLQIAISLSDDINNAENLARIGFSDGLNQLPQSSNDSMPDWAEFVTVRLKNDQRGIGIGKEEQKVQCTKSSSPIDPIHSTLADPGFSSKSCFDGCQFQDLSDDLVDHYDESLALPSIETGSDVIEIVQSQDKRSYLNVHSANIATTGKDSEVGKEIVCSHSAHDKQQRIYFLGLVFYELFSGGDRPPPELLVGPSAFVKPSDAAAEKASASHTFDFTTTLQVLDDSVVDVDCDILSDIIRDHDGLCSEERLIRDQGESRNGAEHRKRQNTVYHSCGCSKQTQGEMEKGAVLCRVTAQVSLERLKLKGIPGPLCNMIYNMIDCINGDFSGDDSYSDLSDVTSDLRLMVEYPEKFLRDLDVNTISLTSHLLNETVFVRNNEFASLQCAYRNLVSGSPEIALIAGESGIGKSSLADRLGKFIVSNGGVFLQGKFDRLHRSQPLAVLARAFNAYCDKLILDTDSEKVKLIASKLEEALGRDGCQLVKVIPTLGHMIVCDECDSNSDATQDCMQNRLYYLMRRFVETISSCSDSIIALFLDDLQWADDVSISIVGEILKSSDANKRFFFLGCYRDDEIENGHPFWKMIESVRDLGVTARIVKLKCLDKDLVTRVLSYLLCLPPRLVRSLSDIVYHKTKGNPLFLSQFILSLNRDGLLYLSLIHRRWEWDEERIISRSLPDDVALLFEQRIGKLPPDVKLALYTLSCFGASIDVDVIKELEADLGVRLIDSLALAEEEGFVTKLNAKYFFCHDRIQEAAYGLIAEEERCLHHMKYGLSLAKLSLNADDNNRMLFVAVGQINLGGPSAVSNDDERLKIVKYNLAAGKIAVGMSEFHSAFTFFDNSISFLKKTHWRDHYDLSLELYELAAECALITGDVLSLTVLTEQVMKNACSFEDTLNISYICMSTLGYASKITDSVEIGLEILSTLGEELPRSVSDSKIELQIQATREMFDELSVMDLLNYKMMTDKKKVIAMKFLRRLKVVCHQVNHALLPIVTLKMVEITVNFGISPMSPIGFAYFGSFVAKLGDIRGGYKLASLAKSLVTNMKLREIAAQVLFILSDILCFIEPLRIANDNRIETEAVAIAAGDVPCACYSRVLYASIAFWSGSKLSVSVELITQSRRFVTSRGHVTSDYYLLLLQQSVLKLIGTAASEIMTENDLKQCLLDSNNRHVLELYYFQKAFVSFVLDEYSSMEESANEFFKCSAKSWMLMPNHIFHALIGGLVSFNIYRETKVYLWLERGIKSKSQLQLWAEQGSSWTFENKCLLLEAEEHFCNSRLDAAQATYDKAIASAKAHKLVHEEAVAYELAAKFYFNLSDFSTSLEYFTAAHEKYCEWGAYAKANSIYACIQQKLITGLSAPSAPLISFSDEVEKQRFSFKTDQRKRK